MRDAVSQVRAEADIKDAIRRAVDGLGGFSRFVAAGERVLIKPNFNTADPFPGSSDPAAVAAFADLCHEAGASRVIVADSSTYFADTTKIMEKLGIFALSETRSWLEIVDLDKGAWVKREIPGARYQKTVSLPALLGDVDKLFFLCCLKTHFLARFTGSLKLAVGLMAPKERVALHAGKLQEKIGELAAAVRPDLVVMDARKCFITGGPGTGALREPGLVLASTDRVALDMEGVRIIRSFEGNALADVEPGRLAQIERAVAMGVDGPRAESSR
ncbi:MAG TPA: DUF362 domain-containing protein [Patescibacteria group bacterium]|nr:DUF362 domain-containing protein [Patescibacteria group bacterium]